MQGTGIPQNLECRLGSHFMDEPRRCKDMQRVPVGIPTLCSFSSPSLESFPFAQEMFSFLGFKAVCECRNFPPVSTPKAQSCLQGDTKHPPPALLTASRASEELEFPPWTRTCSLFSLKEAFFICEAFLGKKKFTLSKHSGLKTFMFSGKFLPQHTVFPPTFIPWTNLFNKCFLN